MIAVCTLLLGGLAPLAVASTAQADTAPTDPDALATVSADGLPTVQINGVVWSQVIVGNTVYAAGQFTSARPAGSPAGTNETPRSNLLAYDITTGALIASFNHSLNAQALAVTKSPDGSRIYVGGDFTTVDGVAHNRIAAFDTATGALDNNFTASFGGQVESIAATASTVYVGGNFFSVNGTSRTRLAAVTASGGQLLSWAPKADDGQVSALVMAPDGSRVIVGGRFSTLSSVPAYGLGAVSATTSDILPFAANQVIRDYGSAAGITALSADNDQVYASGFSFIAQGAGVQGNFEGTAALDPYSGNIDWLNDCHGDTYSNVSLSGVVYSASHAHDCSAIGAFPDTNPRTWHHALAVLAHPHGSYAGTNVGPDDYGWNYNGISDSKLLHWYPALGIGSYTHQSQAAWSVTGNSDYLVLGGEFPTVDGVAQQGLVRMAVSSKAPNKMGPVNNSTNLTPRVVSEASGTARVTWVGTWDYDNENLTYKVFRDGSGTPVYTVPAKSDFWNLPTLGFVDTGLPPGSTHNYRVRVYDPYNNTNNGGATTVTVSSVIPSQYAKDVVNDGATSYWRLGESSGSTAYDYAGFADLTEGSGVSHGTPGAINGDADAASAVDGTNNGVAATTSKTTGPNTFSVEAWFKTTSTSGGKIIGFGDQGVGQNSSNYDRHVYLDNAGHVIFGVYSGGVHTINGPRTYNDGQWHHVVASLSSAGMALYLDGTRVARNPLVTTAQPFSGYWRIGGDNLNGWPVKPSSFYLAGAIDDVAVYPQALTYQQVQQHYVDSGRTLATGTAPADSYGKAVFNDQPDLYYRLDDASGAQAADSSGNAATGTYSGGVTYRVSSPVTPGGTGVGLDGSNGLITSQPVSNPTVYSEELWFNTTTTSGGKLIGFGDQPSGLSSNYDRHVWMLNSGQLEFGVWTGSQNTVTSPASYNDGKWHHVVATQGADGMHLYVDGKQVGTNPQTAAQPFNGYWRVGGDRTWGGASSDWFRGSVDEVAVYSTELSPAAVLAHYKASPAATNAPPVAAFTPSCTYLSCTVDASASTDPDGSVTSYAWDFGDGQSASGPTASHPYAAAGTYSIKLTVTDDNGATNSVTHDVTVAPAPNQPPVAAFTSTCAALTCSFDATASSDPDGSVASYAWNFGDGTTGAGATASHAFPAAGDYQVTLTVTDNQGASSGVSHTAVPRPPANPSTDPFAADGFGRTVASGLGTADVGGKWTATGTTSVSNGTASLVLPKAGSTATAYLPSVSQTNADITTTLAADKVGTGGGIYEYVVGRRISGSVDYRLRVRMLSTNKVGATLLAENAGTETALSKEVVVSGVTFTPGTQLKVRLQVVGTGPTTLNAKVWAASAGEPANWLVTGTDSTAALQVAGSIGLAGYLSGSATNSPVTMQVGPVSARAAGSAPTAAFTVGCSGQDCSVDGGSSTDPSGSVASYTWSWADGTVTHGATSAHTYPSPGTYRITLTVSNAFGWVDVTTRTVTVSP